MKFWQIMKNSLLITIGNPVMAILLLVMNGTIVFFSTKWTFLIVFFMGSLMALVSFWTFYRIFDRMKMIAEKKEQEEAEEAANAADDESGSIEALGDRDGSSSGNGAAKPADDDSGQSGRKPLD